MNHLQQNYEAVTAWASNQFIKMISEGSRDTEDWSNDAENTALPSNIKLHFWNILKIENSYFKL